MQTPFSCRNCLLKPCTVPPSHSVSFNPSRNQRVHVFLPAQCPSNIPFRVLPSRCSTSCPQPSQGPSGCEPNLVEPNPADWVDPSPGIACLKKTVLRRTCPSPGQWCCCCFLTRWVSLPLLPLPDHLCSVQPSTPGASLKPSLKEGPVLYVTIHLKTCQGSSDLDGKWAAE